MSRKIIFSFFMLLVIIIFSCCYKFEFINQPEFAYPDNDFYVPITIKLTSENESGRGYFGICLPIGWTVRDTILYGGVLNGSFLYSKSVSDSFENFDRAREGYYWWGCLSDSVDLLPEGKVYLTPQISTDDRIGTFLISYILTDRFTDEGGRLQDYIIRSDDHPISVGVAPSIETVTNTDDNGEGSLRQATKNAGSGSTIIFDLTYPSTIVLDSQLIIDRSLAVLGPHSGELTISGNDKNRVIYIKNPPSVILSNLNIINGSVSEYGGGIYCGSKKLYLFDISICDNKAANAGGIFIDDSESRFENLTLSNNISIYGQYGGIMIESDVDVTIVNSILWGNSPRQIGGRPASVTVAYSDIQYGRQGLALNQDVVHWLAGNMDVYPLFVDAFCNDYRLQKDSPCIDAGVQDTFLIYNNYQDTLFIPAMEYLDSAPDMGANEFVKPTTISNNKGLSGKYSLSQNYPNPFNMFTTIDFDLPHTSYVCLKIFSLLGEEVSTLISEQLRAGKYSYRWDSSDLATGIYIYCLSARAALPVKNDEFYQIRKMVIIK